MEELALKLSADGIQKKVLSPGKGEILEYLDGTKVKCVTVQYLEEYFKLLKGFFPACSSILRSYKANRLTNLASGAWPC